MTVAATLATAPLIAFHFGELSTVTLLANLLALPAVAPAMWLGMLAAAGGQIPGFPVEAVNAALLAAARLRRPGGGLVRPAGLGQRARSASGRAGWSSPTRRSRPPRVLARRRPALAATVAVVLVAASGLAVGAVLARRRRPRRGRGRRPGGRAAGHGPRRRPGRRDPLPARRRAADPGRRRAARRPAGREAGRGRGRRARRRRRHPRPVRPRRRHRGAARPAADPDARLRGRRARRSLERARAAGAQARRIAAGGELRSGRLRLDVLWPPPELLAEPHAGEDPNLLALVMVARWGAFSMLLTADAEAESTPIDPGPVDVLKVAHHGSDDAGLGGSARTDAAAARRDLGRRRQHLRPPDRRDARDAGPPRSPHPAHRPRRRGRHRGARRLGEGPCRRLRAVPGADGSPTEYSEFRPVTLAAWPDRADATTR